MQGKVVKLSLLEKGKKACVVAFNPSVTLSQPAAQDSDAVLQRLMEMGIVKGSEIKILHEAPFGKDPIAVEIRGSLIGLRRDEADLVLVEVL